MHWGGFFTLQTFGEGGVIEFWVMMLYNMCSMAHATLTAIIIAIWYFTGISSARLVRAEEMELRLNTVAGARSNWTMYTSLVKIAEGKLLWCHFEGNGCLSQLQNKHDKNLQSPNFESVQVCSHLESVAHEVPDHHDLQLLNSSFHYSPSDFISSLHWMSFS